MNVLIILYNGQKCEALGKVQEMFPESNIQIITRADLKSVKKREMIRLLRNERRDYIVIFCADILTQNNIILVKLVGLLARAHKRIIIDRNGNSLLIRPFKTFLIDLPLYLFLWGVVLILVGLINLMLYNLNYFVKKRKRKIHISGQCVKKRSIVYLRTDYGSDKVGGAISHITGFANAAVSLDNDLFFISSCRICGIEEAKTPIYVLKPLTTFNRISVELSQIFYNLKFIWYAYPILKRRKPDLIYQRYSTFNFSGCILSQLSRLPLILEFNSSALWKTDKFVKQRFLMTRALVEKLNLAGAELIVVVSSEVKKSLLNTGTDERKIIINPNGADPDIFHPSGGKINLVSTYGINKEIIVGFAGMFGQWHGIETLVGSVKYVVSKNKDIHFMLIGDGYLRDKLEKIVETEGISEYITFTGIVPKKEIPEYLNACDILVSPHTNMADGHTFFGSPVKIFEYMSMGKPIVASKIGQLEEILQNEENAILVPPDNMESLADAILRLAGNAKLRKTLGQNARNDLVEKYTWTRNAQRILHYYKILSEHTQASQNYSNDKRSSNALEQDNV